MSRRWRQTDAEGKGQGANRREKTLAKHRRLPRLPERKAAEETQESGGAVAACVHRLLRGKTRGRTVALPAFASGCARLFLRRAVAGRFRTRVRAIQGGEAHPRTCGCPRAVVGGGSLPSRFCTAQTQAL